MGRAIVRQPAVFLMDEPLSNLDAKLRVQMRADIKKIQTNLGVTSIYVTHDQVEAMTMGDRVAVMRKGQLQQVAPPQELYDRPVNIFVAGFIGSPAMNMLEARVDGHRVLLGDAPLELGEQRWLAGYQGRSVVLGVRPEDIEEAETASRDGGARLRGRVELCEALGSEVLVHFTVAARQAVTDDLRELAAEAGDDHLAGGEQPASATLVARFSPRTRVVEGDDVEVSVDPRALHFFDPQTGIAIRGA
jgi:multiple sugar transport system ATP-binding protein